MGLLPAADNDDYELILCDIWLFELLKNIFIKYSISIEWLDSNEFIFNKIRIEWKPIFIQQKNPLIRMLMPMMKRNDEFNNLQMK